MSVKIVVDSGFDLNSEVKEKLNPAIVPLNIEVEDKTFLADVNLNIQELIQCMRESKRAPKTSCPSPGDFVKEYQGEESVFVVTLSSALSGTYNSAMMAKEMFLEQYGNKFIHVFDSLSAAAGETLVGLKIYEAAKNNCTNKEIVDKVTKYINEMKTFFVLDTLENLIKAGRINKLTAKIATAFSIKPIMGSTDNGDIKLVEKVRGSKKAISRLIEIIGEQGEKLEEKILGISHCNCREKAESIRKEVLARYNFKDVIIVEAQGISAVYANEDGIVIAF